MRLESHYTPTQTLIEHVHGSLEGDATRYS